MSIDTMITTALAAGLAWAMWRRRDAVAAWLAGAFVLATIGGLSLPVSWLIGSIMLGDAAVVLAMLFVVMNCMAGSDCGWCERCQRARFVGWIGTGKVAVSLMMLGPVHAGLDWTWYAALINGGFVVQVLVAGGWLNGVAVFLDRRMRRDGGGHLGAAHHRKGA